MSSISSLDNPTSSLFVELQKMQQDVSRIAARSHDLKLQLEALEETVTQGAEQEKALDREKDSLSADDYTTFGHIDALQTELDRLNATEYDSGMEVQMLTKKSAETVEKKKMIRKNHLHELLRLIDCGQDMTKHYVVDLRNQITIFEKEVEHLKKESLADTTRS